MKITYTLSKADYLATQDTILNYSKQFKKTIRMQRNLTLGLFFITLAFLLQITAKSGWRFTWLTTLCSVVALGLFIGLFFLKKLNKKIRLRKLSRQAENQPELFTLPRTIELGKNQVKTRIGTTQSTTIQWAMIQKVIIQPTLILYFINDSQANLLYSPSMGITTADYEHLKQLIYTKIPTERIVEAKQKDSEK